MQLTRFHIDTLTFIIRQYDDLNALLNQIPYLKISETEHTGYGCFYTYELDSNFNFKDKKIENADEILPVGICLFSPELPGGADMILYIKDYKIDTLELLSIEGKFPTYDLKEYSFKINPINLIEDSDD